MTGPPLELSHLSPDNVALFLDVDGTLLEIQPHPGLVRADETLRALIETLFQATDGALALVSGRAMADVDRIMAPLLLPVAGIHGAELRLPGGAATPAPEPLPSDVVAAVASIKDKHRDLLIEDKGAAIAVHYRARPDLADEVAMHLEPIASRRGLVIQHGRKVMELRHSNTDKGRAIALLMTLPPFAGRMPVFAGDDLTDESGFATVEAAGGVSIHVGDDRRPTRARFRLPDPQALRGWLDAFSARRALGVAS